MSSLAVAGRGTVTDDGDWYAATKAMIANLQQEVVDGGGDTAISPGCSFTEDGRDRCRARARTATPVNTAKVVLAAGDYEVTRMLDYYTAWDFDSFDLDFINESTGTGDSHKIGLWAGAAMQPGPHPLMTFMAYAYSYLRVNNLGQRYVNEDTGYTGGGNAQLIQPAGASWAIWDDKWREELPAQMPYAGGMSWDQDGRRIQDPWTPEGEGSSRSLGNRAACSYRPIAWEASRRQACPEATDTFLAGEATTARRRGRHRLRQTP
ncbi:MAG: hypothetical protein ACLSDQ_13785 [Adlercreutzia equolifaciens]